MELSERLAIACRVRDLSTLGFKIQIVEAIYLPDEFDLLIEGTFIWKFCLFSRQENAVSIAG